MVDRWPGGWESATDQVACGERLFYLVDFRMRLIVFEERWRVKLAIVLVDWCAGVGVERLGESLYSPDDDSRPTG